MPTADLPDVTISEWNAVRYLHLSTPWVQGAMRMARPAAVELEYVQRMAAALLWIPAAQWRSLRCLHLGLGAATLTRLTLNTLGAAHTTVVELNPQVIAAAHRWFRLPREHERLTIIHADAGAYVAQPRHAAQADLLFVDLYDHDAAAPVLDDEAFYRHCHDALAPGGVMAVNLFGRDARFDASCARIAQAFDVARAAGGEAPADTSRLWRLRATREGNTIVIATRGATLPPPGERSAQAERIETRLAAAALPARKWLRMLHPIG